MPGMEERFELYGSPKKGGLVVPTTLTLDDMGISWQTKLHSGHIAYGEITTIKLVLGDPEARGERCDFCSIRTGPHAETGEAIVALQIFCEMGGSQRMKDRPARHAAYSDFVRALHRRLTEEDKRRIQFASDGKRTPQLERWLMGGFAGFSAAMLLLFYLFHIRLVIFAGYMFGLTTYCIAVTKMFPNEGLTYCPDPLDSRYQPDLQPEDT
jgi:hypothetical protein